MEPDQNKTRNKWQSLKNTSGFRNSVLFFIFVCISALFWLFLTLNDNAQDNFNVKVEIVNMPDSVTFISKVPEKFNVVVRDKGTHLWRNGYIKHPKITIDFKSYASDGVLRFSYDDIQSELKDAFGPTAQIAAVSIDSLRLIYTTNPGKPVAVKVECEAFPVSGYTVAGNILSTPANVFAFGDSRVIDTLSAVYTEKDIFRNLSEKTVRRVKLREIPGVKIQPDVVEITIPVEPLVKGEQQVTITPVNVPPGEELLLFPSKVPVEYYVAMSRVDDDEDDNIRLEADYRDINKGEEGKIPLTVVHYPERLKNLILKKSSVEYAIVRAADAMPEEVDE